MIFLDIETKSAVTDNSPEAFRKMEISYCGCIDYDTKNVISIWDKKEDYEKLRKLLFNADLVVGYNILSFDMPIIANHLGQDCNSLPMLDLMVAFQKTEGFRIKLDILCKATLGKGKIGSGLDAVKYYEEGDLDKLKKYCDQDVLLTMELYEYGLKYGNIKYYDLDGFLKETKIDWSKGYANVDLTKGQHKQASLF